MFLKETLRLEHTVGQKLWAVGPPEFRDFPDANNSLITYILSHCTINIFKTSVRFRDFPSQSSH